MNDIAGEVRSYEALPAHLRTSESTRSLAHACGSLANTDLRDHLLSRLKRAHERSIEAMLVERGWTKNETWSKTTKRGHVLTATVDKTLTLDQGLGRARDLREAQAMLSGVERVCFGGEGLTDDQIEVELERGLWWHERCLVEELDANVERTIILDRLVSLAWHMTQQAFTQTWRGCAEAFDFRGYEFESEASCIRHVQLQYQGLLAVGGGLDDDCSLIYKSRRTFDSPGDARAYAQQAAGVPMKWFALSKQWVYWGTGKQFNRYP